MDLSFTPDQDALIMLPDEKILVFVSPAETSSGIKAYIDITDGGEIIDGYRMGDFEIFVLKKK